MLQGVAYGKLDAEGLWIERKVDGALKSERLPVDQVVVCAGQESENRLFGELEGAGIRSFLIGGAKLAGELDAKRAIEEGVRLAAELEKLLQ
jgi:2,4-dienoyl-CoA reductase (NADPH2)